MQETPVWSLSWEDILEKEMVTYSSILAWEIPGQKSLAGYSPWGRKRVGRDLATKQLCMGKFKSLGSLKSFLCYAPPASVLCLHILGLLRAHHKQWLQSDGHQMVGILLFLCSLRAHQLSIGGGCNCSWLWHPLFTDLAGNTPFLSTEGTLFRKKKACNEGDKAG